VICLISALDFHGLTTQIPHKVYLALPQKTRKPQIAYPPIDVIRPGKQSFSAGIQEHTLDGVPVRIYDREKSIADCFKFRNKVGFDVALEALKTYLRNPGVQIDQLLRYASIDRVEALLTNYLKALT
jgi:predicted transcriptional regulator of viral defense system